MSTYYCRRCAPGKGININPLTESANLTGGVGGYQLDKFLKHNKTGYYAQGVTSLFNNGDYASYKSYVIGATLSGYVEIDNSFRQNLILIAGKPVGYSYDPQGGILYPEYGVKVVLFKDDAKIHAFTFDTSKVAGVCCAQCGVALPK